MRIAPYGDCIFLRQFARASSQKHAWNPGNVYHGTISNMCGSWNGKRWLNLSQKPNAFQSHRILSRLLFDSGTIVHTFDRHTARIWQTNLRNVINQIVRIQTNTIPEAHSKYSQEFMNLFFFSARCLTKDFANVTNPIVIHISEISREKDRIFISSSARTRTARPQSSQKRQSTICKTSQPWIWSQTLFLANTQLNSLSENPAECVEITSTEHYLNGQWSFLGWENCLFSRYDMKEHCECTLHFPMNFVCTLYTLAAHCTPYACT